MDRIVEETFSIHLQGEDKMIEELKELEKKYNTEINSNPTSTGIIINYKNNTNGIGLIDGLDEEIDNVMWGVLNMERVGSESGFGERELEYEKEKRK